MQITSLISGPHVPDSAHFAGRAMDVSLPHNRVGWDFVVRQIESGKWARIGTEASIVSNPAIQMLAKRYGVQMFEDDAATGATGSHVHLEVAP